MGEEVAVDKCSELFGETTVKEIQNSAWKARLEHLQIMNNKCNILGEFFCYFCWMWNFENFKIATKIEIKIIWKIIENIIFKTFQETNCQPKLCFACYHWNLASRTPTSSATKKSSKLLRTVARLQLSQRLRSTSLSTTVSTSWPIQSVVPLPRQVFIFRFFFNLTFSKIKKQTQLWFFSFRLNFIL